MQEKREQYIHSSEIASREFPRVWRGVEPEAVQRWLSMVARSQATLEDELRRAREERDRAEEALAAARARPASAGVRAALLEARLDRAPFGYSRPRVDELLQSAATELSRMETQVALLRAENEQLRRGEQDGAVEILRAEISRLRVEVEQMRGGSEGAATEAPLAAIARIGASVRPARADRTGA